MTHETKRAILRKILLTEWDPIGVSGIHQAQDEYDEYADKLLRMMGDETVSVEEIAQFLFTIATEQMRLSYPSLIELCDQAARAVVAATRSDN